MLASPKTRATNGTAAAARSAVRQRVGACVLGLFAVSAACVSPPRPAGATSAFGPLSAPAAGATAVAAPLEDGTTGPLVITAAELRWTHVSATAAACAWTVRLANPSQTLFRVTLVVQITDAAGRALATSNESFLLGGGDRTVLDGEVVLEPQAVEQLAGWKVDYWVRYPREQAANGSTRSPARRS